jgi:hypothetical protein
MDTSSATSRGATGAVRTIALLGNHAPRQCGIATFTTDLSDASDRQAIPFTLNVISPRGAI